MRVICVLSAETPTPSSGSTIVLASSTSAMDANCTYIGEHEPGLAYCLMTSGWFEYTVALPASGEYYFFIKYRLQWAATVDFSVNGALFEVLKLVGHAFAPSWRQVRWHRYGPFTFPAVFKFNLTKRYSWDITVYFEQFAFTAAGIGLDSAKGKHYRVCGAQRVPLSTGAGTTVRKITKNHQNKMLKITFSPML